MQASVIASSGFQVEIWAQLFLAPSDCDRIRAFLVDECGIKPRLIVKAMHITVYHARRPMPGIIPLCERASIMVPAADTRFMVMAPGGENPRPELEPGERKVGVRVQWQSEAMHHIQALRRNLLAFETPRVLGRRSASSRRTSAFGARSFQPHMALIRAGSGIARDLKPLGESFRRSIGSLHFDRFSVEVVKKDAR